MQEHADEAEGGRRHHRRGHRGQLGRALPDARGRAERRRRRPGPAREHRRLVVPRARARLPDERLAADVQARPVVDRALPHARRRIPGSRSARSRSRRRRRASPSSSGAATTRRPTASRGEIISPAEAARRIPVLDADAILSGYHVPSDGLARAGDVCRQLRRDAEARGAEFNGLTRVTGVTITGGRVRGVETTAGPIATSTLLVCAGIWGPELQAPRRPADPDAADAAPVRVDEPAARARGRDARGRAPDPAPPGSRRVLPPARRRSTASAATGTTRCRSTCPSSSAAPEGHQVAQGDFTPEHFEDSWDATRTLVPPVYRAGIAESFNGHFAFTPDSYPLLGESSFTRGLFFAEAIWVTQAGGSARAIVDQIVRRHPGHRPRPGAPGPLPAAPLGARLRARPRQPAVRRGVRRAAPAAADGAPARPARDAVPRAARAARGGPDRERRLGARALVRLERLARPAAARAAARRLGLAVLVRHDRARAPRDAHGAAASSTSRHSRSSRSRARARPTG